MQGTLTAEYAHPRCSKENPTAPHLLIFTLDRQRYALALDTVQRVVRAAALTELPQAPDIVLGVIDLSGEIVPAVSLRRRFRLPERELDCDDQFVVARAGRRTVALVVDGTEGVVDRSELEVVAPEEIAPGTAFVEGVFRSGEGLVLIHDLGTLLFPDEEALLACALERLSP